jgi:hypothetical protein
MNSAQRRKFRRRWRYRIGYHELNNRSNAYRFHDMVDWCNKNYGAKNWQLSTQSAYWFLFDREERLTLFLLRWSGS